MPFNPNQHALISHTGNLAQDVINASALFFAQKLIKKELSRAADERVYKVYCTLYYSDIPEEQRRAKYEEEIAYLAKNDPKGLEAKLGRAFRALAANAAKRAGNANSYQGVISMAAELGFEPEIYQEDGTPVNFYSALGLRRDQFNFGTNPHKLAVIIAKPESIFEAFDPKVIKVQFPVETAEDVLALERHNDLMLKPRPRKTPMPSPRPTPSMQSDSSSDSDDETSTASASTTSSTRRKSAKPAPQPKPQSIFHGFDFFGQILNNAAKIIPTGGILGKVLSFVGVIMQFVKKMFSRFFEQSKSESESERDTEISSQAEMSMPASTGANISIEPSINPELLQRMSGVQARYKALAAPTTSSAVPAPRTAPAPSAEPAPSTAPAPSAVHAASIAASREPTSSASSSVPDMSSIRIPSSTSPAMSSIRMPAIPRPNPSQGSMSAAPSQTSPSAAPSLANADAPVAICMAFDMAGKAATGLWNLFAKKPDAPQTPQQKKSTLAV